MDVIRQSDDCQGEVLGFLANLATHGGAPVQRIDTHSAVVFLAGDRAFKVKRAVRYSYLDFSTLAQRRAACEAELEINRVFAPGLYLGVIPITREKDRGLRLAGDGEIVEWAVEMRRFDETKTLDHLAEDHAIDLALADKLARIVAVTHSQIPVLEGAPWIAALAIYIEQANAVFRANPDLFDPAQSEHLSRDSRLALDRLRPLLAARSAAGMVRRGHGDLHLGNVVLVDGNPMLFDAIEFSPLIAAGDVLYDLAFLLMDLVERGLCAAANVVLNRYLAETRRISDLDAVAALPFFMSLRAAIRASVTASRAAFAAPSDRADAWSTARKYFVLACRLIHPAPPALVGIGGLSGTGKSQLAAALAPELGPAPGAIVLRSDVERKALEGRRENEHLPTQAYTAEKSARVYAALVEKAELVIAAGHSAIVDAVFARPQERDALRDAARTRGVRFHGLFLAADMATRVARLGSRRGDASDADEAVARAQERYVLGHTDWESIDASGTPESTLARARKLVA
ncbi:MAG TPA: AAA family ATPase [Xanthobacteraceae bacterium]|nr:AAA family ATPase [Xanthobacteraceae bacterium]